MREYEAGRSRMPWRWHPWFKHIITAVTQFSTVMLLGAGAENSLAARKNKGRGDNRRHEDQDEKDRDRDGDRNRTERSDNDRHRDHNHNRDNDASSEHAGRGRHNQHARQQERQDSDVSAESSAVAKKQESQDDSGNTDGGKDTKDSGDKTSNGDDTDTGSGDEDDTGGGDGDGNADKGDDGKGDDGKGDGGGNDAGNAGSGFFDSPLATKARRRAEEFDNADHDPNDDGTFVDVHPDGESVYETHSVSLTTGPDGLEILTRNIDYFAEPAPEPEPLPRLELPVHEPGFAFGEDFPFGNATAVVAPTAAEPSDPGDTGTATVTRAKPISSPNQPEPSSDGGDYTTDFLS
jgi:hypothetical protein